MKRATISDGVFRIAVPGVDVDGATEHQFILHESHLYAQAFFTEWVPCPFSGTTSSLRSDTVDVSVPEMDADTTILIYGRVSNGGSYFPQPPNTDGGGPTGARVGARVDVVNSTLLRIYFSAAANIPAPDGAFVFLLRGANA